MTKPRLLIPITLQFAVRYVVRSGLLARIAEYADPVVVLAWTDEELERECATAGVEVLHLPRESASVRYARLRSRLDIWHAGRVASPSTAIDARRNAMSRPLGRRAKLAVRDAIFRAHLSLPGTEQRLLAQERQLLWSETNVREFADVVAAARPDAVLSLTPFLRGEELLVRAAERAGVRTVAAILSFDNITTRGWIPVRFDRYLLWSGHNRRELLRAYPDVAADAVRVVGTPQFDFYHDPSYLWNDADWRSALSLPAGRPVILFGGGHRTIVPHEPHFLLQIDRAVDRRELPGDPIILFRRHPLEAPERWEAALREARHVIADDPWATGAARGRENIRRQDIERLASTLRHSAVHVNVSSTMTIDGAIVDRPQVGPAYDDRPGRRYDRVARELYEREHFLPITAAGGLALARSRGEMIDAIRDGLLDSGRLAEARRQMVRSVATFDDGRGAERVDAALQEFLGVSGRMRRTPELPPPALAAVPQVTG